MILQYSSTISEDNGHKADDVRLKDGHFYKPIIVLYQTIIEKRTYDKSRPLAGSKLTNAIDLWWISTLQPAGSIVKARVSKPKWRAPVRLPIFIYQKAIIFMKYIHYETFICSLLKQYLFRALSILTNIWKLNDIFGSCVLYCRKIIYLLGIILGKLEQFSCNRFILFINKRNFLYVYLLYLWCLSIG